MIGSRFALVIGNSAYSSNMRLNNPANDAIHIATILKELNFDCIGLTDLSVDSMQKALDDFVERLASSSAEIGLFYFSGHGVSINGRNYILPIDFDRDLEEITRRSIDVQDEIDRISEHCRIKLIFLDACRMNVDSPQILGAKGISDPAVAKTIFSNDKPIRRSGLKEMKATNNTFIAFAAAPGGLAYDRSIKPGTRTQDTLSPFTASLVRHFTSVDLPLSNLMSRVRREVSNNTQKMQIPWDQSSLDDPFYFNPGSLILYVGNIMAIIGLIFSFLPYSFVISDPSSSIYQVVLAAFLPIASLLILLYGMQSVYSRMRGNFYEKNIDESTLGDHVRLSMEKGLIGGFLGAVIGSMFISIPYYFGWQKAYVPNGDLDYPESIGNVMTEIAISTALTAGLLGTLCILATRISLTQKRINLLSRRTSLRTIVSSSIGGTIAGIIAAPLLMWYFGRLSRPQVTPDYLLPGAIFGSSILIFAIVNFDYERLSLKRVYLSGLAALGALACGALATISIFGPLYALGVVQHVIEMLQDNFYDPITMITGSVAYGIPVGFVLGIVIGAAVVLTEKWSAKPVI